MEILCQCLHSQVTLCYMATAISKMSLASQMFSQYCAAQVRLDLSLLHAKLLPTWALADRCDLKWKYLFPWIISQPVKLHCVWQLIPERNVHLHNQKPDKNGANKPQAALCLIPDSKSKVQPRMVNVTKPLSITRKHKAHFTLCPQSTSNGWRSTSALQDITEG